MKQYGFSHLAGLERRSACAQVLVVEDSRTVRYVLGGVLSRIGATEPHFVGTLAAAREALSHGADRFLCAILDLNLPDAPNGEVVDLVREHGLPVVVLTAQVNTRLQERMRAKGVVEYVVKSSPAELEHAAYVVSRLQENRSVRVLVVDDSVSYRQYLVGLLQQYQYEVASAATGHHALELLAQHDDVRLVITDYHMPGMNGVELIQALRRTHRREELAIIGLSDGGESNLSTLMLKSGANDFLTKPFAVEEFYCRVTQNTNLIGYVDLLRDAANRDFLTGVYNRRHLFDVAGDVAATAAAKGEALAVGLIDVDHFKQVNDRFGHEAGDEALRVLAAALREVCGPPALVARLGGEEFVVLARVQPPRDAVPLFEHVRDVVANLRVSGDDYQLALTVSIGVALGDGVSFEMALRQADEAVYQAKREGRNRVVLHAPRSASDPQVN